MIARHAHIYTGPLKVGGTTALDALPVTEQANAEGLVRFRATRGQTLATGHRPVTRCGMPADHGHGDAA